MDELALSPANEGKHRMIKLVTATALGALSAFTVTAQEVGRWCDMPVPAMASIDNLMILKAEGGKDYSLSLSYGDGSGTTLQLTKSGSKYLSDNSFGEYYTIRSDGQLAIYDTEGFIRAARPATRVDKVADCR